MEPKQQEIEGYWALKLIFSKQRKVVSWRFDVTTDEISIERLAVDTFYHGKTAQFFVVNKTKTVGS